MDPTQINQILVNLSVNSRDAMPDGGKLTIETANVLISEPFRRDHLELRPGEYVMLSVTDSGVGMDEDVIAHLFEPFFTTKDTGKGTGLGLAMIYGIVKQNEGFVNVYSEPGKGAAFKLYFNRYMGEEEGTGEGAQPQHRAFGTETVLLVEDSEIVRTVTAEMLRRIGCRVLVAATPAEALALCRREGVSVDLLMTDVVMPEMSGPMLRDKIKALRPELKVLFMSGYTSNVIGRHGVLEDGVQFIQKPFHMRDLAAKVRQMLEG